MRKAPAALGSALLLGLVPVGAAVPVPCRPPGGRRAGPRCLPARLCGRVPPGDATPVVREALTRFALHGLGSPAPVAPPARPVASGPYGYVRGAVHVAVVAVLTGQDLPLPRPGGTGEVAPAHPVAGRLRRRRRVTQLIRGTEVEGEAMSGEEDEKDRKEQFDTALEEVLREVEEAEKRDEDKEGGEAGDAITPNTGAQEQTEGD
ncbi:hypothetical protein AB0L59_09320 [Streptomyces sp. NPDC052109]|uniref:hypothetical protein n=1 Tax=Streptomyces sp. NPDC052109 TaxID=3155527 RepID=UPI00341504CE